MKRALVVLTSFALGAAAVAAVVRLSGTNLDEFAGGLATAGWPALAALVGVVLLQQAVAARSWGYLLPGTRFRDLYGALVVGWAMGFVTPSLYLGGEPIRALYVARASGRPGREVLASVLVQKVLELTTFVAFLLASTAVLLATHGGQLDPWIRVVVIACDLALAAAAALAYLSIVRRWGLIVRLSDRLAALGVLRRWLTGRRRRILQLETDIHRAFARHRGRTTLALAWMGVFTALIFARPLAFFLFVDGGGLSGAADLAAFFCLVQLLQALQLTPGGLGFLEGGIPGVLLLLGVEPPIALAFLTFQRVSDLTLVGAGFALAGHRGLSGLRPAAPVEP